MEVGKEFARRWKGFFQRLEAEYHLDPKNPSHLWLLNKLFLADIECDCQTFVEEFNLHGVKGKMTKSQTPNVSVV